MTDEHLRAVARRLRDVFGGTPDVHRYHRTAGDDWVDVLRCAERPDPGLTSWATIGMSRHDLGLEYEDRSVRAELVGLVNSDVAEYGNMLSAACFNVATGEYGIEPGVIYPDIVSDYVPGVTTKHLLLNPVFTWELENLELTTPSGEDVLVTWLQAVPVTQAEFDLARAEGGTSGLSDRLEDADADVADLDRPSVA